MTTAKDELGLHELRKYPYRPYLQGGSITMDPAGKRLYALDDDEGELLVVDPESHEVVRRSSVCVRPEQVVVGEDGVGFVTCRGDGQVVAVGVDGKVLRSVRIGHEPFGIARNPSGRSIIVTTVTEPRAIALATKDLRTLWKRDLPPEPRGIAISADGQRATVAHLRGGAASLIDVSRGFAAKVALPTMRDGWPSELFDEADTDPERRVAGGAFAVAASPGGTRAFVPYLLKNDGSKIEEFAPGCYANGADLPIAASVAAVDLVSGIVQRPPPRPLAEGEESTASFWEVSELGLLGVVRAAFHDPAQGRLFTVSEGSGRVLAFDTSKADPTSSLKGTWTLGMPAKGLVADPTGRHLFVHHALSDGISVVDVKESTTDEIDVGEGEESLVERGRRLFYTSNDGRLSGFTGVSCSSCHLDGRTDGVTWRLDGKPLQTPSLAGRSFNTKSLRWHGDSPTLGHAVGEAVTRLRGSGLEEGAQKALVAFLTSRTADMERPMLAASRARGQKVFETAGCTTCHNPETDYTDGQTHTFRKAKVRTPSLIGVALSAPYYHDGSMKTLRGLLRSHEADNPMAVGDDLNEADLVDLEKFLRGI